MNNHDLNITNLISSLKKKDTNYSKLSKNFKYVYYALVPVYIILTVLELSEEYNIYILVKGVCFTLAMGIFAVIFTIFQKKYGNVDYSEPTLTMLKKAADRYKIFKKHTWWALLSVLLIDLAMAFEPHLDESYWEFQVIFLGAIVIAFGIGVAIWFKKYKPLRDAALKLIKEIEA
jgi:drug/metabolite transporter (DMT)-like permease